MLQNAYLLAKIGADTAENERYFAEKVAKNWQLSYGSTTPLLRGGLRGDRGDGALRPLVVGLCWVADST